MNPTFSLYWNLLLGTEAFSDFARSRNSLVSTSHHGIPSSEFAYNEYITALCRAKVHNIFELTGGNCIGKEFIMLEFQIWLHAPIHRQLYALIFKSPFFHPIRFEKLYTNLHRPYAVCPTIEGEKKCSTSENICHAETINTQ